MAKGSLAVQYQTNFTVVFMTVWVVGPVISSEFAVSPVHACMLKGPALNEHSVSGMADFVNM